MGVLADLLSLLSLSQPERYPERSENQDVLQGKHQSEWNKGPL